MTRARIAVLASGGGSNLQAIIDHLSNLGERRAGTVVLVASDRPDAGALARARAEHIRGAMIISHHAPLGDELEALIERHSINLVALAGYLQLVPPVVVRRLAGRVINVHPAPLPAYGGPGMYGARVHRAVLASGIEFTGPTVHFVNEKYDQGAVIAHWPVPVLPDDDEHALAARVLRAEHLLYPRVVQAVAAGDVVLHDDGQVVPPFFRSPIPGFRPEWDDSSLGNMLDAESAT